MSVTSATPSGARARRATYGAPHQETSAVLTPLVASAMPASESRPVSGSEDVVSREWVLRGGVRICRMACARPIGVLLVDGRMVVRVSSEH